MSKILKIALLDDDLLFVEALASLIDQNLDFKVNFKTSNPLEFISFLEDTEELPDVAIIDLNMKPLTGLEVIDLIVQKKIDIRIIVLSSLFNSSMYGYMIKYCISGFLPKYTDKQELFKAINQVGKYGVYLNNENITLLNEYNSNKKKTSNPWCNISLTERENEVLLCICEQMSTKEIADKLHITIKTVESHRSKIMEKIGCKNVIGMVIYAVLNGLTILSNK